MFFSVVIQVLQQGVEQLRTEISCFNMGSILIKPVQRILKYPLILNELLKCTEEEHQDKADLKEAVTLMSDVAAFINETKRKKDIVEKYKCEEESTLSRKISKISIHSIGKKSSRMSQKLLTSLGLDSGVRNITLTVITPDISMFRIRTRSLRTWKNGSLSCPIQSRSSAKMSRLVARAKAGNQQQNLELVAARKEILHLYTFHKLLKPYCC